MTENKPANATPEHIAVSRSRGITIRWSGGHLSEYALKYLRDRCPCATCAAGQAPGGGAEAGQSPFQMYKPALKLEGVERVGNYALRLAWNDGHATGIYSYEYLRGICPCCASE